MARHLKPGYKRMVVYLRDGRTEIVAHYNIFKALKEAGIQSKDVEFFTDLTGPRYYWTPVEKQWVKGENQALEEKLETYIASERIEEDIDNTGI